MSKSYKLAALLSYANTLLSIVISLLLTPILQKVFGLGMYGVYGTIGSLVNTLAIMDLGLGSAVIRYVSKYRVEGDRDAMARFLGMVVVLYLIIGAVILVIGVVGYTQLGRLFAAFTPDELATAQKLFLLALGNIALSMLLNIFPATLNAFEEFVFLRGIAIARLVLRLGLILLLIQGGTNPVQVTMVDFGLSVLVAVCYMGYAFGKLRIRVRWGGLDKALLRTIFGYSAYIFLNMIMQEVYWRVDATLVSAICGAVVAAVTVTGGNMVNYFMEFSNAISGMFLPRSVQMVTQGADGEALTTMMVRVGRIQLMVISLPILGFALVGHSFLTLWLGSGPKPAMSPEGITQCYTIVLMLMLTLWVPMFQNVAISITQAMNKHGFRAVMLACIAVLNVVLSIVLIRLWGPVGAAVGTAVSLVVGNTLISNWYYHVKIGLNIPRFFRETLRGTLPALLVATALSTLTLLIPQGSWTLLLLQASTIAAIYLAAMWVMGMRPDERALITAHLPRKGVRS